MSRSISKRITITPIGGLGEIGMNMLVIDYDGEAIIIDCGVKFPDEFTPGIDLVLPSLDYVLRSKYQIKAIILTHGHEDHIGALPFLLRRVEAPIYGSTFTLELIKRKFQEHGLKAELNLIREGDVLDLNPFSIEFIEMSHSICDALGMCIDTPEGRIIHTGDFKIESDYAIKRKTNMERFRQLGEEGVLLLLSDSTNVEVPGISQSEKSVQDGIEEILVETKGWFILSSFASHIPRIIQVLELAEKSNRKVLVLGRSMVSNIEIGRKLGYIQVPDHIFVDEEDAISLPRHRLIVLCTGSQGEPRAMLSKMATDQLRNFKLKKEDKVVFSSRFIPGNEKSIYNIINQLHRRGAEVITNKGADVHVSGHGFREDLRQMLLAVRPKYFIPIHGEYRHLERHQELARETCVEEKNVLLVENGQPIAMEDGHCKRLPFVELPQTLVMEGDVSDISENLVRDRRKLAYCGAVSIVAVIDQNTKELKRDLQISLRGVVFEDQVDEVKGYLMKFLEDEVLKHASTKKLSVSEQIRRGTRRFFRDFLDRKPIVFPVVIEV